MPYLRPQEPCKKCVHPRRSASILLGMALILVALALAGCLGLTSGSKAGSAPNSAAAQPTISGISPSSGPTSGGVVVLISGADFQTGAGVQFGNMAASAVQVTASDQIRAIAPAEASGSVSITVKDSDGEVATVAKAFTFVPAPLEIAAKTLPVGVVGSGYSAALAASGGTPPYTWGAAGTLPKGLHLNTATGVIAGTPSAAGSFSFSVSVRDANAAASASLSLKVSADPSPAISGVTPGSGLAGAGTTVRISGSNFRAGAAVKFGNDAAASVQLVNSTEVQATTPAETAGTVTVTVQNSDGQIASAANSFTFAEPPAPAADVVVNAGQTVSETGSDDLAAAKNIFASASAPESNGGLSDWSVISSNLAMTRMRIINGLGDCALTAQGNLTGCTPLNNNLALVKANNLSPHVIVGQWAPSSIPGNPLQWGVSQWAQYDALCSAIVNYVVNQYGGSGFNEVLFEVGNEVDITQSAQDLWLTPTPNVPQGDPSRYAQYDTVYSHWAKAISAVAQKYPGKKIRIAAPATGFWSVEYGPGPLWENQIIQQYAAKGLPLDVISLHIYDHDAAVLAQYAQSIRSTLNANGNSKAEIWVSEWGASSSGDNYFGAINASHEGAAWAIYFLSQALKGGVTGGSFLQVRDNEGSDTAGAKSDLFEASWDHVQQSVEYPKAIANAFGMVTRMAGTRKSETTNSAKPDLRVLASSSATSASVVVANYNYLFDYTHHNFSDQSKSESVTVAFTNLPFGGTVTVDRYLIDSQTSNLDYWIAGGKIPPSVQATELQKVESFSATVSGGQVTLPARQLGPSAVSLWIVHP